MIPFINWDYYKFPDSNIGRDLPKAWASIVNNKRIRSFKVTEKGIDGVAIGSDVQKYELERSFTSLRVCPLTRGAGNSLSPCVLHLTFLIRMIIKTTYEVTGLVDHNEDNMNLRVCFFFVL